MKLVRNAVTEANPQLRGQKHHFTIENAPAEVLEAMDDALEAEGWANDTCPCYEDGYSCGYWVDLSEINCFKSAYKAAKARIKNAAAKAEEAAVVAEEAEVEAFEVTIRGSVGVDNLFHKGDVVYCGSISGMKATVNKLPKVGDIVAATDWRGNVESRVKVREVLNDMPPRPAHLQAARDAHNTELLSGFFNDRVKPTEARKRELEDMSDDLIYHVFAVAPTAEELEHAHANALADDADFNAMSWVEPTAEAAAPRTLHDIVSPIPRKTRRVARQKKAQVKIASIANGVYTWRVKMPNGKVYLFTQNARIAQQKVQGPNGHEYRDVTSPYLLSRISQAICDSLPKRRSRA